MRVTFASYDDDPPLGGQGVLLHGMRAALERRGVDVATVSGRGDHAIHYPRVTRRAPLDLSLQLNRRPDLLTRNRPDVVHAYGGPGGVLLVRRLGVPLVYTAHHTYHQAHGRGDARRALAPLEARAYRRAAMVLPVSRSTADAVHAMGVPSSHIEVMPPGIDVPDAEVPKHEPARILFVGRLEEHKGVLDALALMRAVLEVHPDGRGVMIGVGPLANAVRERVGSDARFELRGAVDRATLHDEYARASLVVMPSRYEGLGLVALEAQSAGTPVVGYDVDGLRDAAPEGGVLVRVGDVQALRAATLDLVNDASRLAELGARGRDFVRRRHSWDAVADRLLELYQQLGGGTSASV